MATDDRIRETIERLKALALDGDSHENLSSICMTLMGGKLEYGWTIGACVALREVLIDTLEQLDPTDWADEYLDEVGLVRLPKDVDGVPVHVGDRMVLADGGEPFEVEAIGGDVLWFYDEDLQEHHNWASYECRHYKTTVEDVLRSFAGEWFVVMGDSRFESDTVARYADRLREMMDSDK